MLDNECYPACIGKIVLKRKQQFKNFAYCHGTQGFTKHENKEDRSMDRKQGEDGWYRGGKSAGK